VTTDEDRVLQLYSFIAASVISHTFEFDIIMTWTLALVTYKLKQFIESIHELYCRNV